jgi:hypothetical protein
MTSDRLPQGPATDPIMECLRSFDRIAQSGMVSRVAQAVRQWRYRDWSQVPIHSVCILTVARHGERQRRPERGPVEWRDRPCGRRLDLAGGLERFVGLVMNREFPSGPQTRLWKRMNMSAARVPV